MTKDSKDTGKTSTTKHSNLPPEEIRYFEPSHPIFSGQIEVRFGNRSLTSTGDSEGSSNESRQQKTQQEPGEPTRSGASGTSKGEHPYVVLAQTRAVLGGPSAGHGEILQLTPAHEDALEE